MNLAAIDGTLECLSKLRLTWYVPTAVQAEGVFIRVDAASREVRRIDLAGALSQGYVQICAPADEAEHDLYIRFALDLDDGEAMALAIAKNRNWTVATDDRKARLKAKTSEIAVVTTPELVQRWAAQNQIAEPYTAAALRRIQTLARFTPADDSAAALWWRRTVVNNP